MWSREYGMANVVVCVLEGGADAAWVAVVAVVDAVVVVVVVVLSYVTC